MNGTKSFLFICEECICRNKNEMSYQGYREAITSGYQVFKANGMRISLTIGNKIPKIYFSFHYASIIYALHKEHPLLISS